jgi:hypothetical protein
MASSPSYVHGASEQPLIGETIGRAGLILVNINPAYRRRELEFAP